MKSAEELFDNYAEGWSILGHPWLKVSSSSLKGQPVTAITQNKTEMVGLLRAILEKLETKGVALEVGLGRGGTHMLWRQLFPFVVSVENNANAIATFAVGLPDADRTQGSMFVWGDSTTPETRRATEEVLNGHDVDFLFIDGNHAYPFVQSDFMNYEPFVRSGGIIGFHDTNGGGPGRLVKALEAGEHPLSPKGAKFVHFLESRRMGITYYVKP